MQERRELIANLGQKVTAALEERRKLEGAEAGRRQKLKNKPASPVAVKAPAEAPEPAPAPAADPPADA